MVCGFGAGSSGGAKEVAVMTVAVLVLPQFRPNPLTG